MNPFSLLSSLRCRWVRERGAVLVEAALAVPILLLVILGSIEAGMAWEAKSATTAGVRTGLLRAASIGDQPETDLRILQSIIGEIGADNVDGLEWVVIFDATDPNHAATIESCRLAEAGGGIFDTCNTYGAGTQFADIVAGTVTQANFDDGGNVSGASYVCDTTRIDANWCAPKRLVNGDIQVGIALSYQHDWFTGIFPGDGVDFEDYATSSTFIGEGSNITPSGGSYVPPTSTVFDSGSFDPTGPWSPGWSGVDASRISSVPNDSTRHFLGPFGTNEQFSLYLDNLAAHSQVCVTFDLYIINSWDNNNGWGPYTFNLEIDNTEEYEFTTNMGEDVGETERDTLGYGSGGWGDAVVPVSVCVPHTGSDVTLDFISDLTESIGNESWGIDNLVVELA